MEWCERGKVKVRARRELLLWDRQHAFEELPAPRIAACRWPAVTVWSSLEDGITQISFWKLPAHRFRRGSSVWICDPHVPVDFHDFGICENFDGVSGCLGR